jgi:quercetin dioxygenase-like cupin family protein
MNFTNPEPMKPETIPAPRHPAPSHHMSAARMEIKAGTVTPTHRHDAECMVVVLHGSCCFYMSGHALTVNQNETLRIPARIDHCAEALADTVALNISSAAESCARYGTAPALYHDPDQDLWGV